MAGRSTVSGIERFDLMTAQQEAQPLVIALQNWSRKNISTLKSAPAFKYKDFPQRLTWRGQDLVEPLLQLADQVGGDYPTRARQSLLHLFDDPARQQQDIATQLLRDLRDCFKFHNDPQRIATAVLVEWLHGLPSRPWDVDGSMTPQKFARLLTPFQIKPRLQRMGKSSSARGYQLQDFVPLWQNLLDNPKPEPASKDSGVAVASSQRSMAKGQGPVSPNKNAVCNTVTDIDDPDFWLPPILMPSDWANYNYGPHSDHDVTIISHFAAQGYKALSEKEARRIEFSCGNLPFGTMAPRTSLEYPAMPVRTLKPAQPPMPKRESSTIRRAEPPMTEAERAAAWEKIRRDRDAPPKCAQLENFRLAPQNRR